VTQIKPHPQSVLLACAAMLGSTIALSMMHASVRYLSADLHPFVIAFFRNLLAVFFLLPIIARHNFAIMKSKHMKWHVLRASLGYLIFGEHVSVNTWIGAVFIFSGACYIAIREHQLEKQKTV